MTRWGRVNMPEACHRAMAPARRRAVDHAVKNAPAYFGFADRGGHALVSPRVTPHALPNDAGRVSAVPQTERAGRGVMFSEASAPPNRASSRCAYSRPTLPESDYRSETHLEVSLSHSTALW